MRFSTSDSQPSSAGSWSGPMSPSTGQASTPGRPCRVSSTSRSSPSGMGTRSSLRPSSAGVAAYLTDAAARGWDGGGRGRHRRRAHGPGPAGARPCGGRRRDHRLRGQDDHQGPPATTASASAFPTAASERSFNNELGLPLTLLNAPDDAQWVVLEMGARGVGHIDASRSGGPARGRHRDQRGHGARGVLRRPRWRGAGEERARDVAAPDRASPSSTTTTPAWPRMASVSPCPVLGYGVDGDAEVRAEERRARRRPPPEVPPRHAVGHGAGAARVARGAAGPERAGGSRGGAVVRRPLRRRRVTRSPR